MNEIHKVMRLWWNLGTTSGLVLLESKSRSWVTEWGEILNGIECHVKISFSLDNGEAKRNSASLETSNLVEKFFWWQTMDQWGSKWGGNQ